MFARRLASFTVTVPTTEVRPSGSFVPKNGILTAPFTPAGPWWMCPSVGAAMPVQVKAYDTWLPWMRTREVPLPSLSPPAGCILLGTSLLPRITVPKNIASLWFLASYLPIESVGIAMFIGIGIGIGGGAVVPPFGVAGAAGGVGGKRVAVFSDKYQTDDRHTGGGGPQYPPAHDASHSVLPTESHCSPETGLVLLTRPGPRGVVNGSTEASVMPFGFNTN